LLRLTALLAQTLVAYAVEFDNEFEHRAPHRTTVGGQSARGGPWLVSMVMWFNCMRHVSDVPIPVLELERRSRTPTNLDGMRRWGYVDVAAEPEDTRAKPPRAALVVRATPKGLEAQEVWRPLAEVIEQRWEERWGTTRIAELRAALLALVSRCEFELPDCLPILGYGLWSAGASHPAFPHTDAAPVDRVSNSLPTLLARALLSKRDLVRIEPNQKGRRGKVARLTTRGTRSRSAHERLLQDVEQRWESRFGPEAVRALRGPLESLAGDARGSLLFAALQPHPEGWRASVPKPETLPHFPMVLHRGGYPDGS
jgi:hypothetical protein